MFQVRMLIWLRYNGKFSEMLSIGDLLPRAGTRNLNLRWKATILSNQSWSKDPVFFNRRHVNNTFWMHYFSLRLFETKLKNEVWNTRHYQIHKQPLLLLWSPYLIEEPAHLDFSDFLSTLLATFHAINEKNSMLSVYWFT